MSGRVGTKFPVGDPLTPEGGPGRAELRLEEEEPKETEEAKRVEEEVSEAPSSSSSTGGWELFGHLVVEDLSSPGRVSKLRCVRCGAEVSLLDLKTLREKPCVEKREVAVSLPQKKCGNCGREAVASLCDICAEAFERYSEAARPAPFRGRGGVKPPSVPGVDGWAWVSSLTTFFPYKQREGGREWWCPVPGCQMKARRLVDVTDHFREAHPFEASRGWYEEYDAKTRQTRIRTWQGWVDEQLMTLVLEPESER